MELSKIKILVASPHSKFLAEILPYLKREFSVQISNTLEATSFLIQEWEPNFIVIDGDSSLLNGIYHFRSFRGFNDMGVIVSSTQSNIIKEEKAFQDGADYFLTNSPSFNSLKLRILNLYRRMNSNSSDQNTFVELKFEDKNEQPILFLELKIFPKDFIVKRNLEILNTTPTQFRLLVAFVTHSEQLLTRDWLKTNVWEGAEISHRSIDAQISKLKRQVPELDRLLVNIYGKGYILTHPQKSVA